MFTVVDDEAAGAVTLAAAEVELAAEALGLALAAGDGLALAALEASFSEVAAGLAPGFGGL